MSKFRAYTYLLVCTLTVYFSAAQNETNYWFFGNTAGINFNTNPPTVLTNGILNTIEGCASMADQNGNLVLYTDGSTVYTSAHTVMANGTGLFGNSSSTQSGIILKKPGTGNIYYIFSQQGPNVTGGGCYYSVVDMSLAAGAGSVITKNVSLYQPSTEKLVATKHCNGIDYWIITRDANTNNFRCFLLNSSGVSSSVVTSTALSTTSGFQGSVGYLKMSPNGRKLANCAWVTSSSYDIYDFDNNTGLITNPMQIYLGTGTNAYACEFSPDGTKFYGGSYNPGSVYQWDLCAGSPTAVVASSVHIFTGTTVKGAYQLAPDGKIYIARINQSMLAVINNPNSLGTACGFVDNGFSIAPKVCMYGLPNVITSGLKQPVPPFTHTVSNSFGCQTASFTAPPILQNFTVVNCVASGYSLTGLQWNFGDPASGSSNTSTSQNPAHAFTNLGTYTVSLIVHFSCGGGTDTVRQVVNINQPCISVTSASITCANLGSATVSATGGIGPFSYTWMPGAQTTSIATGLHPGSYTITVFDFGNNFTYTSQVQFTSLIPLTASLSTTSSVTCFGAATGTALVNNLAGGSGTQSILWTNGTQSYTTAFTNSLSAGIWSINVTDALTGCQINQSFLLTQPPALQLSLSASNYSSCVNTTVVLTGTNSGGTPSYTYTWTNGPASTITAVTEALAGIHTYTLSSRDLNNCLITNTVAIDFIPTPTLSVPDVSVCPLKTGTLIANGATSYTWFAALPSPSATGNSYTNSPLSNEQFTVIGSALGCTALTTAYIVLHPSPVPVLQTNSPRCENTSVAVNVSGGASYVWAGPSGFNSSSANNTISPLALHHAGVYQVTVTSVNSCTASSSLTVEVDPSPTIAIAGSTVCTSQTLSLIASSIPNAVYRWTGPVLFSSSVQSPTVPNPAVNRSGTYTLLVTAPTGCQNTATVDAQVVPPPTVLAAVSTNTLCHQPLNTSPNTVGLSLSGALSYSLYSPVPVGVSGSIPAFSTLTVQAPYSATPAVVQSTIEGSNGVCTSFTTFKYTVIPNPTVVVTPINTAICAGESTSLNVSGATFYTWSASAKNYTVLSAGTAVVTKPNVSSLYSVYGSSSGCHSSTQTSSVTVHSLPTLSLGPVDPTICLYEKITLTAYGNGTGHSWSPIIGILNPYSSSVIASPPASQEYTVIASSNNCTTAATIKLNVLALPEPTIVPMADNVCEGELIKLQGLGGMSYEWRGPLNSYYEGQNIHFLARHKDLAGQYTLTVTDTNGCKNTTEHPIKIRPLPTGSILDFKEEACQPYCATYVFAGSNNSVMATWMVNKNSVAGTNFSYCYTEAGRYTVSGSLTDQASGCKNTVQHVITIHPKPAADFMFTPLKPVEDLDEVKFKDNSTGDINTWNWFFETPGRFSSQSKNPSYIFDDPGKYTIVMVVNTPHFCSDTIIKNVAISADFAVYVPNAFTPNGDQQNDEFKPVVGATTKYDLKVYNRWGQEIFHSKNAYTGWDGSFNGSDCKQDTYTWQLELTNIEGEQKKMAGVVNLIR